MQTNGLSSTTAEHGCAVPYPLHIYSTPYPGRYCILSTTMTCSSTFSKQGSTSQIHVQAQGKGSIRHPRHVKSTEPEPRDRSSDCVPDWPGSLGSYRDYAEISDLLLTPETWRQLESRLGRVFSGFFALSKGALIVMPDVRTPLTPRHFCPCFRLDCLNSSVPRELTYVDSATLQPCITIDTKMLRRVPGSHAKAHGKVLRNALAQLGHINNCANHGTQLHSPPCPTRTFMPI